MPSVVTRCCTEINMLLYTMNTATKLAISDSELRLSLYDAISSDSDVDCCWVDLRSRCFGNARTSACSAAASGMLTSIRSIRPSDPVSSWAVARSAIIKSPSCERATPCGFTMPVT
jgi:hypothetical protein